MALTIRHECPQCGGPFDFQETHRILPCPFCGVQNFLHSDGPIRYVLPPARMDRPLLWVPYVRFRGSVFVCAGESVEGRVVDMTGHGFSGPGLPFSLGLRPQALKLAFRTPALPGRFLKNIVDVSRIIGRAEETALPLQRRNIFLQASIGETVSLLYLPLERRENGALADGITGETVCLAGGEETDLPAPPGEETPWTPRFLATICPECGWNLSGDRESVVLFCENCRRAWSASDAAFREVTAETAPMERGTPLYLPFWKIAAKIEGPLTLSSFADFIRATNQPVALRPEWRDGPLSFWIPAFKIRPDDFLRLSRHMTLHQDPAPLETGPARGRLHPVTLPAEEAVQGIPVVLAHATLAKKILFPHLPGIRTVVTDTRLVHVPFREGPHDFVQDRLSLAVHKKTLDFGRYL